MRVKAFHLSSLKVKLLCEISKAVDKGTVYQFVRVNGKVFHLPSLQRRKLNYYAKDQRMWTEAEIYLITYSNLALPPSPLGRNFKEKHFENYIFSEYICQTSNLKSILKTTFVLNFKANHLKTIFFKYIC